MTKVLHGSTCARATEDESEIPSLKLFLEFHVEYAMGYEVDRS